MTTFTSDFTRSSSSGNYIDNKQEAKPHNERNLVPTSPKMKQILKDYWVSKPDRRNTESTASQSDLNKD